MSEVVQQVSILGNQPGSLWSCIVGTKNRGQVGLLLEGSFNSAKRCSCEDYVRIHEEQDITLSVAGAVVSRGGRTGIGEKFENANPHRRRSKGRSICGSIIDDNNFEVGRRRSLDGCDTFGEILRVVVDRDNEGEIHDSAPYVAKGRALQEQK